VRVLLEGEEEIGSPTLHTFLQARFEELRADVLLLADAGNWDVGVPGLTYSLRGLAAADIELRALDGPQHSGVVGGAIPDPVMALSRVLASLVDEHGDPCFDGAFAGLRAPTAEERRPIAGFDDTTEAFAHTMGVRPGVVLAGDPATTLHERLWLRPTLTVIGIDGHPIKGSSNQIVAVARARISMRLGPGQEPERVLAGLREQVEHRVPWGLELGFRQLEGSPAWQTDPTGPAFDAARQALHAGFGVEPVLMGTGGSIPFVGPFADAFGGVPALLLGPDDPGSRIHGENESLHLGDWQSLIRSEVYLLSALTGALPATP
jgi:acetylornithine deacetylase/succinyl-diaminopimelate desuccinylase-like protein